MKVAFVLHDCMSYARTDPGGIEGTEHERCDQCSWTPTTRQWLSGTKKKNEKRVTFQLNLCHDTKFLTVRRVLQQEFVGYCNRTNSIHNSQSLSHHQSPSWVVNSKNIQPHYLDLDKLSRSWPRVFSALVVCYKRTKRGLRWDGCTHKVFGKTIFRAWSAMQEGQELRVAQEGYKEWSVM